MYIHVPFVLRFCPSLETSASTSSILLQRESSISSRQTQRAQSVITYNSDAIQHSVNAGVVMWVHLCAHSSLSGQSIIKMAFNQSIRPLIQTVLHAIKYWLHSRSFLRTLCTAQAFLSWGFAKLFAFWPLQFCTVTHSTSCLQTQSSTEWFAVWLQPSLGVANRLPPQHRR